MNLCFPVSVKELSFIVVTCPKSDIDIVILKVKFILRGMFLILKFKSGIWFWLKLKIDTFGECLD